MKIRYTRSGGVAGIRTSIHIDCEKLPEKIASMLDQHLKDANIFHQPSIIPTKVPIADTFHHDLEITDGSRTHRIQRDDSNASSELQKLFDALHKEAIRLKKKNPD